MQFKLIRFNHYIQNDIKVLHNIILPYFKFVYVVNGTCDVIINDEVYPAKAHDIFVVPPYTIHHARFINNDLLNTYELIFSSESIVDDDIIVQSLNHQYHFPDTFDNQLNNLCDYIDKHDNLNSNMAKLDIYYLISKTILLLSEEKDHNNLIKNKGTNMYNIINKMLELLNEDIVAYGNPYDICQKLDISSSYLYKCSKEILHDNPSNFIIKYKISKSYKLLSNLDYTIDDVSNLLGYENQFYFSKQFKKITGISPSKFKEQFKK